jgi:non-ribosomal peptide synthase protein (TIGR01720 family)
METLLLAAFAVAWRKLKGADGVALWIEGHGREDLFEDAFVGRTVGWFTTQYPLWLPMPTDDCDLAISLVKSTLEEIPNRGLGFGALRYLPGSPGTRTFREFAPPRILFNFLGSIEAGDTADPLFRLSEISTGDDINPRWLSPYDLSIGASISGGKLELFFRCSRGVLSDAEAARLGSLCKALLEEMASVETSVPRAEIVGRAANGESPEFYRSARPGAPKVFFFPPKLSIGLSYFALAQYLTSVELVAFDFIERPDPVGAYVEYIGRIQPCGPYILGAYSSATLALEVAQAMQKGGATVSDIILLDAVPTLVAADTLTSEVRAADSIEFFTKDIKRFGGECDEEFVRKTGCKIREYSRYINTTCNRSVLDATFHFIKSRSTVDEPKACEALSFRKMKLYGGFGEHSFMLNGSAARKNAVIIRDIVVAAHGAEEARA